MGDMADEAYDMALFAEAHDWPDEDGSRYRRRIEMAVMRGEKKPGIRKIATLANMESMDLIDLLDALRPYLLEDIPEGVANATQDELEEIDRQIGRLANTYAYVTSLFGYAAALARRAKSQSNTSEWHEWNATKDALYRILQALEMKWRACSRMVTVDAELDFERPDYQGRADRATARRAPGRMRGWDSVSDGTDRKR